MFFKKIIKNKTLPKHALYNFWKLFFKNIILQNLLISLILEGCQML
jgi:hypothetical protein